jgi:hypothetical protein
MKIGPINLTWRKPKDTEKAYYGSGFSGFGSVNSGWASASNHPVYELLENCTTGELGRSPRYHLEAYRMVDETIPILSDARDWLKFAVGKMEVCSDDPGLQELLRDFSKNFAIKNSKNTQFVFHRGLPNYILDMLDGSLRDGMSFGKLFAEGPREPIEGVITHDASCFEFRDRGDTDETIDLWFNSRKGIEIVNASSDFVAFSGKRDDRWAWGLPLGYGTLYFHQKLLMRIMTWEGGNIRQGYPIGFHILSAEAEDAAANPALMNQLKGGVDPNTGEIRKPIGKQMSDDWKDGVNKMRKTGRGFDPWAVFAGKMKYDHHVLGAGVPLSTTFPEDYQLLAQQIARRGPVPLDLLDLSNGAAGIGSDKFRVAAAALAGASEYYRGIAANPATKIFKAYLASIGAGESQMNNFYLKWNTPSIEDYAAKAKAKLDEANAVAQQWANRVEMGDRSRASATAYADELGRPEWMDID